MTALCQRVALIALLLLLGACKTAQAPLPCTIRGPEYTTPCIDDPTVEGAYAACPCVPMDARQR